MRRLALAILFVVVPAGLGVLIPLTWPNVSTGTLAFAWTLLSLVALSGLIGIAITTEKVQVRMAESLAPHLPAPPPTAPTAVTEGDVFARRTPHGIGYELSERFDGLASRGLNVRLNLSQSIAGGQLTEWDLELEAVIQSETPQWLSDYRSLPALTNSEPFVDPATVTHAINKRLELIARIRTEPR